MDDIFERRLETRRQIVMELRKQMRALEEDIKFECGLKSWARVEKLKHYQLQLMATIDHFEALLPC